MYKNSKINKPIGVKIMDAIIILALISAAVIAVASIGETLLFLIGG